MKTKRQFFRSKRQIDILKPLTVLVLLLFVGFNGMGQPPPIWSEDFSNGTYSVTIGGVGNGGTADYFNITDGSNINISYSGYTGNFFAGQDIDDGGWTGSASPSELTWTGIDITGYTSLSFSGDFASSLSGIDNADYVNIQYKIDAGNWTNLLWFRNNGAGTNQEFAEDTDFSGTCDGTDLTAMFATFSKSITGTGTYLDLRITVAVNSGGEDFAFDEFEIYGTYTLPLITLSTSSLNGFYYKYGNGPSNEQSFTVGGSNLTNDITITPDTNYEISTASGSGFDTATITLTQSGGTVSPTTIYTRLKANLGGNVYNKTIKAKSTGATTKTISCEGAVVNAWINEFHYDNDGTDVNEFVEIVIQNGASFTLSDFTVYLVNGYNGAYYDNESVNNFTTGVTTNDYTIYYNNNFSEAIQNGPDGLAIRYSDTLVQFLSYEGTFSGTEGIINGIISTDVGVSEGSSTISTESLQLVPDNSLKINQKSSYNDFIWVADAPQSQGNLNDDGTDGGSQALPIELTSFKATPNNNLIYLSWSTASEINNDFFTIERSQDGNEYAMVTTIPGSGTSNETNNYETTDDSPIEGLSYYRLRQTDFNGESKTSSPVAVYVGKASKFSVSNPIVNEGNLSFDVFNALEMGIYIYDISGKLVYRSEQNEEGKVSVSLSNFDKGVYILKLVSGNHVDVIKFVY